jgi:hypothetical protein
MLLGEVSLLRFKKLLLLIDFVVGGKELIAMR